MSFGADGQRLGIDDFGKGRERGWYYARSANRHSSADWRGPYRSEASVAMMIARQLRREIVERYRRQLHRGAS
jgi:hypothetical protein